MINKEVGIKGLQFFLIILINFITLNGIRKVKIQKLKKNINKENKIKFWITLLLDLSISPIVLFIYLLIYILIVKILVWFVIYLISTDADAEPDADVNPNSQSDWKNSLKYFVEVSLNNIFKYVKLYGFLFIFNIVLLICLFFIILLNDGSDINDPFIDKIYNIHEIIMQMFIFIIYWRIF